MKHCTYCKIFYNEINNVLRDDDVYENYERKGGNMKFEHTFQYTCERCGSIYYGVP